MGEHSTWFDFLNALPAWQSLHHTAQHHLERRWKFAMFDATHFTLSHVLGFLLVAVFIMFGAISYKGALARAGKDGIVPPAKFGLRNLFEMFCEGILALGTGVMGKENARKYMPFVGSIALLIFFSNALALIPGFAPPTDTLKTNLALSLAVFFMTHVYGVRANGLAYFKHFLGPIPWLAPLMLPIELISHIARPASLALRLMGNMASDHKVVAAFFTLVPLLVPVPFLILGIIVVIVQTLVFTLLSMVYIGMAVAHDDHH